MGVVFIGVNNPETMRMITAVRKSIPGFRVRGFLDNDPAKKGRDFFGYPIIGGFEKLPDLVGQGVSFVNLITRDAETRYTTSLEVARAGGRFTNFVHPSVNLEMVRMGVGNYIQEGVMLQAGVSIGDNSSIHMGSLVAHEIAIGNSVFIAHGCNLSGLVSVHDGVFMGTGVSVIPRLTIGEWAVIGAVAVVMRDVPPYSLVVGNPGRVVRTLERKYESGEIRQR